MRPALISFSAGITTDAALEEMLHNQPEKGGFDSNAASQIHFLVRGNINLKQQQNQFLQNCTVT